MSYISYYKVKIIVYNYKKSVDFSDVLTGRCKMQAFRLCIVILKQRVKGENYLK
jgi:hypothetical protein